jgi:taurine dioxygenase
VLFLRDQDISGHDQVAFASRIGQLEDHLALPASDEVPGLVRIYKTPEHEGSNENAWHHDNTWRPVASKACVLRCVQCPSVGGDTMWGNNMALAYEKLPDSVKAENAHEDEQEGDSALISPVIFSLHWSHHFML